MNKEIWRRRSIEANIRNQIVNFFDDSKDEQEHESEVCNSDSSDEEKKKDTHLKGHSMSNLNMNDDNVGVARHIEHSSNNNMHDDWSSEGNNVLNSSDEDVEVIKKNMNNFLNDNIRIERVNFGMKPMNGKIFITNGLQLNILNEILCYLEVLTFEMKKSKRQLQYFSEKFNSLLDELIMRVKVLEDHHVYCVSKINGGCQIFLKLILLNL